jgi:hypothetical protein
LKLTNAFLDYGYDFVRGSVRLSSAVHDVNPNNPVCHMAVFAHKDGVKKVLTIKGTSPSRGFDIIQDIKMLWGWSASIRAIRATCEVARQEIADYNVNLVTGHSLGGYYAEILATNGKKLLYKQHEFMIDDLIFSQIAFAVCLSAILELTALL